MTLPETQARVLFRFDGADRLTGINEPDATTTPLVHCVADPVRTQVWTAAELPPRIAREAPEIVDGWDWRTEVDPLGGLVRQLSALVGGHDAEHLGPCYRFPDEWPGDASTVLVDASNAAVLDEHFPWLVDQLGWRAPVAAVLTDGSAVWVCYALRSSDFPAEAGVDTAPEHRGRGLAAQAVAAWATAVEAEGRHPLYSTSWANLGSRKVAAKLGLVPYAATITLFAAA